jgi:hypothetical protein
MSTAYWNWDGDRDFLDTLYMIHNSTWNGEYDSFNIIILSWISTEENNYKRLTAKFTEFSFADVHKAPFMNISKKNQGICGLIVYQRFSRRKSKIIEAQFIIWAVWYWVWGELGECVLLPQSSPSRVLSPHYRSARQRNREMNPWGLTVSNR